MTLSISDHAIIAKSAYLDNDKALELVRTIDPDFELDNDFSNTHYKTYVNPKTNKVYAAFRGTRLNDKEDHTANSLHLIGAGGYSSRFKSGHKVIKGLVNKYTRDNVSCSAHSLGGNICSDVSKKQGIDAVTFNKGKGILPNMTGKKEKSYRVVGDPLSQGGKKVLPKTPN